MWCRLEKTVLLQEAVVASTILSEGERGRANYTSPHKDNKVKATVSHTPHFRTNETFLLLLTALVHRIGHEYGTTNCEMNLVEEISTQSIQHAEVCTLLEARLNEETCSPRVCMGKELNVHLRTHGIHRVPAYDLNLFCRQRL